MRVGYVLRKLQTTEMWPLGEDTAGSIGRLRQKVANTGGVTRIYKNNKGKIVKGGKKEKKTRSIR